MAEKIGKETEYRVFQFTHPGTEHSKGEKLEEGKFLKLWNPVEKPGESVSHRRKYLRCHGEYIDKNSEKQMSSLDFWGEWEPDSIAKELNTDSADESEYAANYIQYPVFLDFRNNPSANENNVTANMICRLLKEQDDNLKREGRAIQNTDPFVYGNCFMYSSICKPEQTITLKPGSIILFGSTKNRQESFGKKRKVVETWYRVDTVFVIKEVIDIDEETINQYKGTIYYKAALQFLNLSDKIKKEKEVFSHKLFFGATVDDPYDGMYSYIPAHISSNDTYQTMRLNAGEFPEISQGIQSRGKTVVTGNNEVKEFWERLRKYTYKQGYVPADRIDEPRVFSSADELADYVDNL